MPKRPFHLKSLWKRLLDAVGGPQRLKVIVLLGAVLGLDAADKGAVSAVSGELKHAFHIGNTDVGMLFAMVSFIGAAATLPMGILADRLSRRKVLMVAISTWAVAMILSGTATSFVYLLSTRVALGVVTAAAWPCVASLTGDFFPAGERAATYGLIVAGELIGMGTGFLVSGEVSTFASWRSSFFAMAGPAIVLVWVLWRYLPEPERGSQRAFSKSGGEVDSPSSAGKLIRESHVQPRTELVLHQSPVRWGLLRAIGYMLKLPTYRLLIVASALVYYFFAGARSFSMIYLTQHWRLSPGVVSALVLVLGLGALVGVVGGGRISEQLLRKGRLNIRIVLPAVALLACVPLLGLAVWTHNIWFGLPLLVISAGLLAAAIPPIDAARLDIVLPGLWGRGESGRMAIRSVFEGGAPLLFGAMSGWLGGGERGLMRTFLLMLIPMLAASALGWWARHSYLQDVATVAASIEAISKAHKQTESHRGSIPDRTCSRQRARGKNRQR